MQRSSILYTCVMSIEGDDIFYAHIDQFLQCRCTVKRFTSDTFALTAFIKVWHDNVDSAGFAANSSDRTLQILEVVVRRHHIGVSADGIIDAVVTNINHNINIIPTYGFADLAFTFTGTETRGLNIDEVGITLISFKSAGAEFRVLTLFSPFYKPFIYFFAKGTAAIEGNKSQPSYRKCCQFLVV